MSRVEPAHNTSSNRAADGRGLRVPPSLWSSTLAILGSVLVISIAAYLLASHHPALGPKVLIAATALLMAIFGIVLVELPLHRHSRFGYANLITAIRAAMVSVIGATVFFGKDLVHAEAIVWTLIALVTTVLALDGLDGKVARRYAQESEFGARFDMEIDALHILILSSGALILGKAGWWVLAIGLMRYAFVAAGWLIPSLNGSLPPSLRRKTVCVIQVAALSVILVPFIVPPVSTVIAASALVLLVYSFAVDSVYLLSVEDAGSAAIAGTADE
ncbi:CDP-alcohol phosphatidyltransferase family protein [Rhizobium halophytocola]|uniref:Phosphatidylglycerophosphate synthase n=1 Tax=Rhizobium halophytocola TaxID=735519 RepID=A0ABS4DUW0_9HYPH|nr:CDP-alcohol phosphatidyltransferase family protein [Rhizobium halophytocola]MBP1849479.1 phosphatidylglycerophosphate synthase [Rhizobium halophytocola]